MPNNIEQQCKICLDGTAPFVQPCLCKGSLGMAHQQCLLTWMQHCKQKINNINHNQQGNILCSCFSHHKEYFSVDCQVCKSQINAIQKTQIQCLIPQISLFIGNQKETKIYSIIFMFLIVLFIGCFIGILYIISQLTNQDKSIIDLSYYIKISIIGGVLIVMIIAIIIFLFYEYFLQKKQKLIKILTNNKNKSNHSIQLSCQKFNFNKLYPLPSTMIIIQNIQ